LTEAGILKRRQNGNRVYFQADTTCPVFSELAQILFKTVGLVEILRKALEPLHDQIHVAFVYGSIAASAERSISDIDLMVIGPHRFENFGGIVVDRPAYLRTAIAIWCGRICPEAVSDHLRPE